MDASSSDQQQRGGFLVLSRAVAEWSCGGVPTFVLVAGCLAAVFGPAPWSSVGGVLALLAGLAFVVPGRLRIGPNSVTVHWLWTVRTVPLEEIELVSRYQERVSWVVGLRLDLRSGVLLIPMRSPMGMSQLFWFLPKQVWGDSGVDLAVEVIDHAVETHARRLAAERSGEGAALLP
jgi:hypothetical protein